MYLPSVGTQSSASITCHATGSGNLRSLVLGKPGAKTVTRTFQIQQHCGTAVGYSQFVQVQNCSLDQAPLLPQAKQERAEKTKVILQIQCSPERRLTLGSCGQVQFTGVTRPKWCSNRCNGAAYTEPAVTEQRFLYNRGTCAEVALHQHLLCSTLDYPAFVVIIFDANQQQVEETHLIDCESLVGSMRVTSALGFVLH